MPKHMPTFVDVPGPDVFLGEPPYAVADAVPDSLMLSSGVLDDIFFIIVCFVVIYLFINLH